MQHLAGRGYAVVYPRFEKVPGEPRAPLHALSGTVIGLRALGYKGKAPVVVMVTRAAAASRSTSPGCSRA